MKQLSEYLVKDTVPCPQSISELYLVNQLYLKKILLDAKVVTVRQIISECSLTESSNLT